MPVFFIERGAIQGETVSLTGPLARHLKGSLRIHPGENVWLPGGGGAGAADAGRPPATPPPPPPQAPRAGHQTQRWQSIALEAAQQSMCWEVPVVAEPQPFDAWCAESASTDCR